MNEIIIGIILVSNIYFFITQYLHFPKIINNIIKIICIILMLIINIFVIVLLISSIVQRNWVLAFVATSINYTLALFCYYK